MLSLILTRTIQNENGTVGILSLDGMPICVTLENPWKENQHNISCIPAGVYTCEIWQSPTKGNVYRINNVPDRQDILIHAGNTIADTAGCVLLGLGFGVWRALNPKIFITSSKVAIEQLCEITVNEPFVLEIRGIK